MKTITNNRKTALVYVIAAVLATILAVAPVGINHSSFAHKENFGSSNGIKLPTITDQRQNCQSAGGTSPVTGACIATSTNTIDESGGVVGGP